jgi:hypothetical protein
VREGQVGAQVVVLRDVDKRKTAGSSARPGRFRAWAWDWYKLRGARSFLRITTALGMAGAGGGFRAVSQVWGAEESGEGDEGQASVMRRWVRGFRGKEVVRAGTGGEGGAVLR